MRSSKSRSRSKSNRPRSMGNVVNRVFDSSGPEGKVRGTPQQIIEKYLILARDAQLSNDRVAAENFLQHAEHYTRLLGEAQRELAAEQEARQQQYQQGGQNFRDRNEPRGDYREERDPGAGDQPDLAEPMGFGAEDSVLVETPEARDPAPPRREGNRDGNREGNRQRDRDRDQNRGEQNRNRDRREFRERTPRPDAAATPEAAPQPAPQPAAQPEPVAVVTDAPAAEAPAPKPRKPAAPRKPRAEKPAEKAAEKPAAEPAEKPEAAE